MQPATGQRKERPGAREGRLSSGSTSTWCNVKRRHSGQPARSSRAARATTCRAASAWAGVGRDAREHSVQMIRIGRFDQRLCAGGGFEPVFPLARGPLSGSLTFGSGGGLGIGGGPERDGLAIVVGSSSPNSSQSASTGIVFAVVRGSSSSQSTWTSIVARRVGGRSRAALEAPRSRGSAGGVFAGAVFGAAPLAALFGSTRGGDFAGAADGVFLGGVDAVFFGGAERRAGASDFFAIVGASASSSNQPASRSSSGRVDPERAAGFARPALGGSLLWGGFFAAIAPLPRLQRSAPAWIGQFRVSRSPMLRARAPRPATRRPRTGVKKRQLT